MELELADEDELVPWVPSLHCIFPSSPFTGTRSSKLAYLNADATAEPS